MERSVDGLYNLCGRSNKCMTRWAGWRRRNSTGAIILAGPAGHSAFAPPVAYQQRYWIQSTDGRQRDASVWANRGGMVPKMKHRKKRTLIPPVPERRQRHPARHRLMALRLSGSDVNAASLSTPPASYASVNPASLRICGEGVVKRPGIPCKADFSPLS